MRALIGQLGAEGRTVVLSSHDMEEVEDLCSRVAVIGGGRLLAQGTPAELRGQLGSGCAPSLRAQAAAVAATLAGVARAELTDGLLGLDVSDPGPARAAEVNKQMIASGLDVSEVRTARRPLREVLLELTGGRTGGADSLRHRASQPHARQPQLRRRCRGPPGGGPGSRCWRRCGPSCWSCANGGGLGPAAGDASAGAVSDYVAQFISYLT